MSCGNNVTVEMSVHQAAAIRQELFRSTKLDSYEFPGQRTVAIREVIVKLDEAIKSVVGEGHEE